MINTTPDDLSGRGVYDWNYIASKLYVTETLGFVCQRPVTYMYTSKVQIVCCACV